MALAEVGPLERRYRKPPVAEALCEVVFAGSEWDQTVPGRMFERIRDRFPMKEEVGQFTVEIRGPHPGPSAEFRPDEPRLRFARGDRSQIVQIGRDLVVVNQLPPYAGFERWRPLVPEMVGIYRELARPTRIERIGVRYINRVVIPAVRFNMETYFRIYPMLPVELGDEHGRFLLRMEVPAKIGGHEFLVTISSAPPPVPEGATAILLDLYDVTRFRDGEIFDSVTTRLAEAHDNVVAAFENAITDSARALFEEEVA